MSEGGAEAFFLPEGDRYLATLATRGPWNADHQHGGPPAALLARAIEAESGPEMPIARMTVEFLKPMPMAAYRVEVAILRRGRRVAIFTASLMDAHQGTEVCRARALAVRTRPLPLPERPKPASTLPAPAASAPFVFPFFAREPGYQTAIEGRLARGRFGEGNLAMWMRMRIPLLPGEVPSPLTRVMIAADSTNGVSAALDTRRYSFINADLTVHLHRLPVGEWVCLDALTLPEPSGVGLAESVLHDEQGRLGRAAQTLVIEKY